MRSLELAHRRQNCHSGTLSTSNNVEIKCEARSFLVYDTHRDQGPEESVGL